MESESFFYNSPEKLPKSGDNFIIEDLLDFSNEDIIGDCTFDSANTNSTDSSTVTALDSCNSSFTGSDFGSSSQHAFPDSNVSSELCVPLDDIAELEWLSTFGVEETFSSDDLQNLNLISGIKPEISEMPETKRDNPIFLPKISVPAKARSKRSRISPCSWSSRLLGLSPSNTGTGTMTSSSSESDVSVTPVFSSVKKPKQYKKREACEGKDGRRCLHCATDKTPQWRTGPLGPKTLCNACGVRYKSGRLVPEYRPASSPTFVMAKHSNSHRKVMEMRRQKEMQTHRVQPEQFLYPSALFDVPLPGCADDYLIHHRTGSDFAQLI